MQNKKKYIKKTIVVHSFHYICGKIKFMKTVNRILFLCCLILPLLLCNCKDKQGISKMEITESEKTVKIEENKPYLKVLKEIDFGTIKKGDVPSKNITIDVCNMGDTPLVILKTDVACSCMKVMHTKQPIFKGEKGDIKVEINTTNQNGFFNKAIFVRSNAQNDLELVRIKGRIS